ncbi:family 20 glycosylhydrolase [Kribbella sp. GL6]|uniref:family 20 glycosylhydrolase n=1 Tax=Kribbella sp. GL6 TaxID=3419765 RepID=UPI003D07D78D
MIRKGVALLAGLILCVQLVAAGSPAVAGPGTNAAPRVLPSIDRWQGGQGSSALTPRTRIVVNWSGAEVSRVRSDALTFARDLSLVTGFVPEVGDGRPRPGDLVITRTAGAAQSYAIEIGTAITITAADSDGAFYAQQTLEQLLRQAPDGATLARGTITDRPRYVHRGFLLDVARHFYSVADVKRYIRTAAWQKQNVLHWHLTDSYAVRLPSDRYPQLTSERHYTKAQLEEIVGYARQYHVTIIPEFEVPGHANRLTERIPELAWNCHTLSAIGNVNVTKPESLTVVVELIKEWARLFPDSPILHLGGDEYAGVDQQQGCRELVDYAAAKGYASTVDVFVDWQNKLAREVVGLGRRPEIWNWWDYIGGATITPDKNIVIDAWYGASPQAYLDAGYTVVMSPDPQFYVVPTKPPGDWWIANTATMYSGWDYLEHERLLGYEVSLFGDDLLDVTDAYADWFAIRPLEVLAETTWHGPDRRAYPSVLALQDVSDRIGGPPGLPTPVLRDAQNLGGTPYGNVGNAAAAFDDDPATFADSPEADGRYVGIDLGPGRAARVDQIRFLPRGNDVEPTLRMVGGRFEGCTDGPASGCHPLATVEWRPTADWRTLPVTDSRAYRWLRWVSPDGGHGNVGEIRFQAQQTVGTTNVTGADKIRPLADGVVTATFTNTGPRPLHDVRLSLTALSTEDSSTLPAQALDRDSYPVVPSGRTIAARFALSPGLTAGGGYLAIAETRARDRGTPVTSTGQHGFDVETPITATLTPQTVTLPGRTTLTVRNAAAQAVSVEWSTRAPDLKVTPGRGTVDVPAGGVSVITIALGQDHAEPGLRQIEVAVRARHGDQQRQFEALTMKAGVPYPDLRSAFGNVGVTSDADIDPPNLNGGFDGSGSSFSAEALAGIGIRPGAEVTADGFTFHWPDVAPGEPNNALANGQTIALSGRAGRLGLLTSASFGPLSATGTVNYTDGTSTTFRLDEPDWTAWPTPPDAKAAFVAPYRNYQGQVSRPTSAYVHSVELDPAKTVASVELPPVGDRTLWTPALHVFALALA